MRWAELCAFTAIYRSHEGNLPGRNHQIDSNVDTFAHFGRFGRVYAALAEYRTHLCVEAAEQGLPLVRHLWLHYPGDPEVVGLKFQYLLGSDFLVAPVLDQGSEKVRLYLPSGRWKHLWSGQEVVVEGPNGLWGVCVAPMGYPPLFYLSTSAWGEQASALIEANKDLGPAWQQRAFTKDGYHASVVSPQKVGFGTVNAEPVAQNKSPMLHSRRCCGCARRRGSTSRVLPV